MATVNFKGAPVRLAGSLPTVGQAAPAFSLVGKDLSAIDSKALAGKWKVLNIFPSIDTGVCATSVRKFTEKAGGRDASVLHVSADLPFAHKRFCGAEGIEQAKTASTFRSTFAKDYGVEMTEGALAGLCARAVVVVDGKNVVRHVELVPDIGQEPNYDKALGALG